MSYNRFSVLAFLELHNGTVYSSIFYLESFVVVVTQGIPVLRNLVLFTVE